MTTNSTSDSSSGTGGEPAKPHQGPQARRGQVAATSRPPPKPRPSPRRRRRRREPPAAKPAAKRAPAKSRAAKATAQTPVAAAEPPPAADTPATAAGTPVAGGGVETPLAPDQPTAGASRSIRHPDARRHPEPPPGPSNDDYEKLIGGDTHDPHGILGAHPQGDGTTVIRTLRHHAKSVTLLQDGKEIPFESTYGGVFSAVIDGPVGDYRVRVDYGPGAVYEVDDPYRWLPTLGEMDLLPDRRGPAREPLGCAGRARPHLRHARRPGHRNVVRGLGAERPRRPGHRRLRSLVRRRHADALARLVRGVGAVRAGRRRGHPVQVPDPRPGRCLAGEGRPDGVRRRGAAGHRVDGHHGTARMERRRLDGHPGADRSAQRPAVDLRDPRRVLAGWASTTGRWPTR